MSVKIQINTFRPICFVYPKYAQEVCNLCSCSVYEHPPYAKENNTDVKIITDNGKCYHQNCFEKIKSIKSKKEKS